MNRRLRDSIREDRTVLVVALNAGGNGAHEHEHEYLEVKGSRAFCLADQVDDVRGRRAELVTGAHQLQAVDKPRKKHK